MKKIILILSIVMTLTGCARKSTIYFYSPDKSQCVTLIDEDNYRYVIDGKHNELPETGYVKLYSENTPVWADAFYICWKNSYHNWEVVIEKYKIVESKLDSSKYKFSVVLPKDKDGIPTQIKFCQNNCAVYDIGPDRFYSSNGTTVEYK
jgi:hypothetical protein